MLRDDRNLQYYHLTYVKILHAVSFIQTFQPKPSTHFCSLLQVQHAPFNSLFLSFVLPKAYLFHTILKEKSNKMQQCIKTL